MYLGVIFASEIFGLFVGGGEINSACGASAFLKQYTHPSSFPLPCPTLFLFASFSLLYPLYLSLPDNECRSTPSYVFSSAWRLVSAHGPLIINLTLCAGRLIIPTYLYDADLTSSPGLCFLSLPLFMSGLLSRTSCKDGISENPHHKSD